MKFRRKQMIVKGRFQSGYIGWFLLTTIVIATLALVIMYWGVWRSSINEFSTQRITEDMGLAKRIQEYSGIYDNPYVGAERGYIDDIIMPHDTRKYINRALDLLKSKFVTPGTCPWKVWRKYSNINL